MCHFHLILKESEIRFTNFLLLRFSKRKRAHHSSCCVASNSVLVIRSCCRTDSSRCIFLSSRNLYRASSLRRDRQRCHNFFTERSNIKPEPCNLTPLSSPSSLLPLSRDSPPFPRDELELSSRHPSSTVLRIWISLLQRKTKTPTEHEIRKT